MTRKQFIQLDNINKIKILKTYVESDYYCSALNLQF